MIIDSLEVTLGSALDDWPPEPESLVGYGNPMTDDYLSDFKSPDQ